MGEPTFLQNQPGLEHRRYLTFDEFARLAAAKSDPDGFVSSEEPLTIDEAHKWPEIFTAIKRVVIKEGDPAGLKAFLASTPHCKGGILGYKGGDAVQLGEKLWALPPSLVLS